MLHGIKMQVIKYYKLLKSLLQVDLKPCMTLSVQSMDDNVLETIKRKNMDISNPRNYLQSVIKKAYKVTAN